MRVLFVTKKYVDVVAGDAWYLDALAREFGVRGHSVFVAAPNCPELRRGPAVRAFGPPIDAVRLDRLGPHRLRLLRELRDQLPDLLAWSSPDLVHAHSADLGYEVSRSLHMRVPVVLTCHSLSFPALPLWSAKAFLERWCLRRGRFRAVTALHSGAVEALESLGVRGAICIPGGVDARLFSPGPPHEDESLRVLYAGRLEPEKGLGVLLRAMGLVQTSVHLSLVGDGSQRAALAAFVRARGLDGRVALEPPIASREAMAARYRAADAFVLPSLTEGGIPLVVLEAWASGLPTVATTRVPVADFGASEAALQVPPGDPTSLARALDALASDGTLRRRMGDAGRAVVLAQFRWEDIAERFLALYASLAAG